MSITENSMSEIKKLFLIRSWIFVDGIKTVMCVNMSKYNSRPRTVKAAFLHRIIETIDDICILFTWCERFLNWSVNDKLWSHCNLWKLWEERFVTFLQWAVNDYIYSCIFRTFVVISSVLKLCGPKKMWVFFKILFFIKGKHEKKYLSKVIYNINE